MRLSEIPNSTRTGLLRLVQVGAGLMGEAWLGVISGSLDTELVGLVDLDLDVARRAAERTGVGSLAIGRSLPDVLARVAADAVVNVTVPAAHRAVSVEALRAGLPVLSEKPLAGSVAAGLSIIAATELTGQLLMVSQSRRYFQQLPAFRDQIAQIGPVGLVHCAFYKAPHFGGFREQMDYPLLIDMAIHHFDLARDLLAADPLAVVCESFNPAWSWYAGDSAAHVSFEFPGGVRFGFAASWCSPGLETSWNGSWRVSGADGSAVWDGEHEPVAETADGHRLAADITSGPEQIAGSLAEFVAALRTGAVPSGEAHSNVLSLTMVEAAIRSAREARRVEIAEVLADAYADALDAEDDADVRTVLAGWTSVHDAVGAAAASRHLAVADG
jgi:predicted dehydrogenase